MTELQHKVVTVRSCGIRDCIHSDRFNHRCKAEEIDIGKHPIHGGLGCLSYVRDNVLLREQLSEQVKKRAISFED